MRAAQMSYGAPPPQMARMRRIKKKEKKEGRVRFCLFFRGTFWTQNAVRRAPDTQRERSTSTRLVSHIVGHQKDALEWKTRKLFGARHAALDGHALSSERGVAFGNIELVSSGTGARPGRGPAQALRARPFSRRAFPARGF